MVIRRAGPADLPALAALRREQAREQQGTAGDPEFEARFADWSARESAHRITWLAETGPGEGQRMAGMMNLALFERMPRPGRPVSQWGYLANAFVLAAYRNQGTGGRLLDAVLRYGTEAGLARVVLSPSERSVEFYRRAGFRPADTLLLWTPPDPPGR
jgi:GNAT superfamily N-acetyltransferase